MSEAKKSEELLERAFEIVRSAYATYEWVKWERTARTDETLQLLMDHFAGRPLEQAARSLSMEDRLWMGDK